MARGAALLVLLAALGCGRGRSEEERCRADMDAHRWVAAESSCPEGTDQYTVVEFCLGGGTPEGAMATAERLRSSRLGPAAAFCAGYNLASTDKKPWQAPARDLLLRASRDSFYAGNVLQIANAERHLTRSLRIGRNFDAALEHGNLALFFAKVSRDPKAISYALVTLGELFSDLGFLEEARDRFTFAEDTEGITPDVLAYAYMKHGTFLADLDDPVQIKSGVDFLERVRTLWGDAIPAVYDVSIELNLAFALARLDRPHDAERALTIEPENGDARRVALVRGYIAARRDDIVGAEKLFTEAALENDELDYRWQVANELGRAYERAHQAARAEARYQDAIHAIEKLRAETETPELRPWVLRRRIEPYRALVELYAEQGRGLDALSVAESLHARAWQDVVIGTPPTTLAAEAGRRFAGFDPGPAAEPLTQDELLAKLAGREAVVLLDAGDATWRLHAAGGAVDVARLSPANLDAIARFRLDPDDLAAGRAAAAALLPPDLAARTGPIYIVANNGLATLPFPALRVGDRRLVDVRTPIRLPGLALLGCADGAWPDPPVYLGDSLPGVDALPAAAAEVRRLGGAAALVGDAAKRAALRRAAHANLLHVAVHTELRNGAGALRLSDGVFTAAMVLDEKIGPRTAVLAGCATAASADAESFGGFPSAFLAAGSRHVIATLVPVEDTQAATFMRAYSDQPASLSPAERLARAQRALASRPAAEWASWSAWGDDACWR